ncbi:N-acetylmuramoyl-L-alanine amidase [Deinococcus detaillensis]|nr:N-acetylmuramoyl-L-alanine amidase [Deinococcus detaillensis]
MTRFVLSLFLAMCGCFSAAAPRIGSHDGYTRLVFELPAKTSLPTSGQLSGQTYTVQLSRALPSESGVVSAPGLSRWTIQGQRITLNLRGGGVPKLSALPAASGQAARLVIDVPISAKTFADKKVTRPTSLNSPVTVVIDPGHGGVFPGMSSQWVVEKNITMDVALRVRSKLEARGVKVILTRSGDTQISTNLATDLDARSRLANNGKVGAFISIHVNAGGSGAQGIETYYFGAPMAGSSRSLAVEENGGGSLGLELTKRASTTAQNLLGDLVAQAKLTFSRDLAAKVQQNLVQATGAVNRGVRSDTFVVILHPTTPAILTEIGFGSSPTEGPKLASAAYRDQIAGAIAGAIASYLHVP